MVREIDPRMAAAVIAAIVVVIGVAAWRMWATPSGLRSPQQAGLGRPMKPGEIPGQAPGIRSPISGQPR